MNMKYIDNDNEHKQILYELGLLDDEEDWLLYQKMVAEDLANEPDEDTWHKYMKTVPREIPNDDFDIWYSK